MKLRKIMITAASCLALAIAAVPVGSVSAENAYTTYDGSTTDDTKNTTRFTKYLVMNNGKAVPASGLEFTFTVEAGKAQAAASDGSKQAVLAGISPEKITLTAGSTTSTYTATSSALTLTITDSDTKVTETGATSEKYIQFGSDSTGDEQYIKKDITIDFSSVPFTEPGIYRYTIKETATNDSVANGFRFRGTSEPDRTLDVYVSDASDDTGKKLKIEGYAMYYGDDATIEESSIDKSNSITNLYETSDLTITKAVEGNQGSKDKYFKYEITITGTRAETYQLTGDLDSDLTGDTPNNATIYTSSEINTANKVKTITLGKVSDKVYSATKIFYLQAGQSVTIQGLEKGKKYSLTEYAEDYTATLGITGDNKADDAGTTTLALSEKSADNTYTISDDYFQKDTTLAFTNTRKGTIPTGVIMTVAPYAIGGVVILALIVFLVVRSKKRYEDEEA